MNNATQQLRQGLAVADLQSGSNMPCARQWRKTAEAVRESFVAGIVCGCDSWQLRLAACILGKLVSSQHTAALSHARAWAIGEARSG